MLIKIICDVMLIRLSSIRDYLPLDAGSIGVSATEYDAVIKYINCTGCGITNFQLLSTYSIPTRESVAKRVERQNIRLLSPVKKYEKAYNKILTNIADGSINIENLKFIDVLDIHPALSNVGSKPEDFTEVFQTIIDSSSPEDHQLFASKSYETGYTQYYLKYPFIEVNNFTENVFPTFGAMNQMLYNDQMVYSINGPLVPYLLRRNKNILKCPVITYSANDMMYNKELLESYAKFIERDIVERLNNRLYHYRICWSEDSVKLVLPVGGGSYESIKNLCAASRGTLTSMQEAIENSCKKEPDIILSDNEILKITCENYNEYLYFDQEGEIIAIDVIQVKLLSVLEGIKNEYIEHHDL